MAAEVMVVMVAAGLEESEYFIDEVRHPPVSLWSRHETWSVVSQ